MRVDIVMLVICGACMFSDISVPCHAFPSSLGEAPKDLFDEVARDVMTDLKLDAFPRFKASEFYKKYVRTKYIETVKVNIKDFTTFRVLGRGGFGAVHACRKKNSGTIYAMKCINKKLVKVKSALDNVMEERNVLTMMKSNFVTNLKYALQDEDTLYLMSVGAACDDRICMSAPDLFACLSCLVLSMC